VVQPDLPVCLGKATRVPQQLQMTVRLGPVVAEPERQEAQTLLVPVEMVVRAWPTR
jgi:hypothetical protein